MNNRMTLNLLSIFMILGKILLGATLDYDDFNGTGQFINAKGGSITSPDDLPYDDVIGTLYVSGDFGENDYSETIETDIIFSALDFNGLIVSDSPVYEAEIGNIPSTPDYYFVLTRNKFDEGVIENRELGRILELGYFDDNNLLKDNFYNEIKIFYSSTNLNDAVEETFGVNYFPLVTKQSLEILTNANRSVLKYVSDIDEDFPIGYVKMLGNYTYQEVHVDRVDSYDGYETNSSIISFGAEKKLSKDLKIGVMGTFVDSTTDMDNSKASRDDFFYLGLLFAVYRDDTITYSSVLSLGGAHTDIYRFNSSSLGDYMNESDMTSYFIGLNNSVYKRFQTGKSYIKPGVELNIEGLKQGAISENGDYGLEIDEIKTLSVKPGLGIVVGRDFGITHKTKLNLEADAVGYVEAGEPYKDLDVRMKTISSEKAAIEKYDYHHYHLDLSLKQSLKSTNGLNLSLVEKWVLFENQDRFEFNLGLEVYYVF